MEKTDWYPGTREEQLTMAKNWAAILAVKGADWGVPAATVTAFSALVTEADGVLAAAKNDAVRTPVVTAHCREVFERLEQEARDIKKRYFFVPPLTEADIAALGLKMHDPHPTPSGKPTSQVRAEPYLTGLHQMGFRIVYVSGSPGDPANKVYRVWYVLVPPGGKAPSSPEELTKEFSTKRMKDVLHFAFEDSGKTVYMAVQIGNGNMTGDWGPMTQAIVP